MKKNAIVFLIACMFFSAYAFAQDNRQVNPVRHPSFVQSSGGTPFAAGKPAAEELAAIGDRLSDTDGATYFCDWSNDGNFIAYANNDDIYVMSSNGGNPVNLTEDLDTECSQPVFSSDSSGVLFTSYDDGTGVNSILFAELGGGHTVIVRGAAAPAMSSDGNYLLYRDTDDSELVLHNYSTSKSQVLLGGDYMYGSACFMPDNQSVIASQLIGGYMQIVRVTLDGTVTQLTFDDGDHDWPDVSPDGKWILYTSSKETSGGNGRWLLNVYDVENSRSYELFPDVTNFTFQGDFSADGSRFIYLLADEDYNVDVFVTDFPDIDPEDFSYVRLLSLNDGVTLNAGQTYDIKWESNGVDYIDIQYTSLANTSAGWINIAQGVDTSSGVFHWTVPSHAMNDVKIRLIGNDLDSVVRSSVSINAFNVVAEQIEPTIELVYPNGSESLTAGENCVIQWSSTGIEYVHIWYTVDSGINWVDIAENLPASDKDYSWTIPSGLAAEEVYISVGDETDDQIYDNSDAPFSIKSTTAEKHLRIISPNGGEQWTAGESRKITWESRNVDTINISYTYDGSSYDQIARSVDASTGSYEWTVPGTPGENCKVLIYDTSDSGVTSMSYARFTIKEADTTPYLRMISPNGGEVWQAGESRKITWEARNVGTVSILYNHDGSSYETIAKNIDASSASYDWTVPGINSTACRVRIVNDADVAYYVDSYATFTIEGTSQASITVLAPNGGEEWWSNQWITMYDSTKETIKWSSTGVSTVKIQYSTSGRSMWKTIEGSYDASIGYYDWELPDTFSRNCFVRVVSTDNSDIFDTSNDAFSLFHRFYLSSPVDLESYAYSDNPVLTFNSNLTLQWPEVKNADFYVVLIRTQSDDYIPNGLNEADYIVQNVDVPRFSTTLPATSEGEHYNLYIEARPSAGLPALSTLGYGPNRGLMFKVEEGSNAPEFSLSQPNGGEMLSGGDDYTITWASSNIDNVNILFSRDDGAFWDGVAASVPAGSGSYVWTVPDIDSDKCLIRVESLDGSMIYDMSDGVFSIEHSQEAYISVESPRGVENWSAGSQYDITWTSGGVETVTIQYSPDDGVNWHIIADGVAASNGSFSWTIPSTLSGNDFLVAIIDESNTDLYGVSEDTFDIVGNTVETFLDLKYPTANSVIQAGSDVTVAWDYSNVNTVRISYSIDDGNFWTALGSVSASDGSYQWSVPDDIDSSKCLVRVADAEDTDIFSQTEGTFTITGTQPSISVDGPYANETYGTGDMMYIEWTSESVATVDILISIDGGNTWTTLYESVDATSRWQGWTISSDAVSNTCYVRIVSSDNDSIADTSGRFSVMLSQSQTQPYIALDSDFSLLGIQSTPVQGVDGQTNVGFAVYAENWASARKYRVRLTWDSSLAEIQKNLSLLSADSQEITINNATVTLGTVKNIFDTNRQLSVINDSAGVYEIEVTSTASLDFGSSLLQRAIVLIPVFTTVDTFGSSDELNVTVDVFTTGLLGVEKKLPTREFRAVGATDTEPYLSVSSPTGSNVLEAASTVDILWDSYGVSNVKIEYSVNGGADWKPVIDSISAPYGKYEWVVPDDASGDCKIRLTDIDQASRTALSDGVFTIQSSTSITILAPTQGETIIAGGDYNIKWIANNVDKIHFEFSLDGGQTWQTEDDSVTASDGQFYWQLGTQESENARIRLTSTEDDGISAISPTFQISAQDFIEIKSPVSGDQLSVDTKTDIRWQVKGVSSIIIEISYNNGDNWTILEGAYSTDSGMYSLVPGTVSDECKIRLKDKSRPEEIFAVSETFAVIQPSVTIDHQPADSSTENAPITFTVEVSSSSAIESVVLTYQNMGDSSSKVPCPMSSDDGINYTYTLPAGYFGAPGIEYYIEATDITGVEARSPGDDGFYAVSALVSDMRSTQTISGGSTQNSYRMISIPLELSATSITEQLKNALPSGDMGTEWRLFRYPSGDDSPLEYPDIEPFEPGKAYWVIASSNFTLKAAEGTTVTTEEAFQLELKSGWNDIANPWTFDIYWSDIENPGNANLSELYSYDGAWSDPTNPPKKLEPWKGYSVKNLESSTKLVFLNPRTSAQKENAVEAPELWRISIRASAAEALDYANHIGVKESAEVSWDISDHVEPPAVGSYVQVSFPHEDWNNYPGAYTVDFRPPEETIAWDFTVGTNIGSETVDVEFDGVDSLPEDAYVTLIDRDRKQEIALDGAGFSFTSAQGTTERHFTLIVSGSDSPGPEITGIQPEAMVIATAYPNPFNPRTTIQYELTRKGNVTIQIFNSLGQTVAKIKPGEMEAGIHTIDFDADGMTSGLYFYRIDAGHCSTTGKMLYMK